MVYTNVYIKNFGETYDDEQLMIIFSEFGKFNDYREDSWCSSVFENINKNY